MTIKARLTLQFVMLASLMLGATSLAIYVQSGVFRRDEFYGRMTQRAENTAVILLQVDEVDEALLQKIERTTPVKLMDEGLLIIDHKGQVLFKTGRYDDINPAPALIDKVKQERNYRFKVGENEGLGLLYHYANKDYTIFVHARDVYGIRKQMNLLRMMLITNVIAVFIMLFLGRIYARRALEPVQSLVKQVKSLDEATLANRVDEGNGKDEIAQLAHSFNDLLYRLESSFKNQRQFIANASHELRTPLTAISGQMEVLLMRERDLNQYRETVASVLDDLRALSVMTNRLLILAQTGSTGMIRDFEVLRIDEAVWSARTELLKLHPTYKVHVNMAETEEPDAYNIFGNDQLIRTVLLNLMDNACKYSADHRVTVSLATDGSMVALRVVDDGIGIPAEDLKTIAEPFFRGSNTAQVRGHGLGLSMVKRIVELHEGSFDIQSVVNQGTKVTVTLPVYSV